MCTPRFRCIPEHLMHKKIPRFHDAHRGLFTSQSAHTLFSGSVSIADRIAVCSAFIDFAASRSPRVAMITSYNSLKDANNVRFRSKHVREKIVLRFDDHHSNVTLHTVAWDSKVVIKTNRVKYFLL
eukprot:m.106443 g.106443  ORF g.106443 m.106443 type:complete len:126 (-) comp16900_c0_seq2:75-452(-)